MVYDGLNFLQVKLQAGRAATLAARPDKLKAWDTESVFANAVRFPKYGLPGHDSSDSRGAWRTTRFLLKAPGEIDHSCKERAQPDQKRRRFDIGQAPFSVSAAGCARVYQPGADLRHAGAARLLADYSMRRFVRLVESKSPLTNDCLNEFVSLVVPAGFAPTRARKRQSPNPRVGLLKDFSNGNRFESKTNCGDVPLRTEKQAPRQQQSDLPQQRAVPNKKGNGKQARILPTSKGDRAFESFSEGVDRGIIYRSIIQSQPSRESLEDGEDSDSKEEVIDEIWRLELGDKQLSEFLDTTALEKMYMNLWNKFISHDVYVYADRYVLDVVTMFAAKYGTLLSALYLEVIFTRHLGELYSRGLLDAKGMHQAVVTLGKAKESPKAQQNLRSATKSFPFYTRVLKRDRARKEKERNELPRSEGQRHGASCSEAQRTPLHQLSSFVVQPQGPPVPGMVRNDPEEVIVVDDNDD